MNKVEAYKVAFELTQEGNSVLLFAFESTAPVVYELLVSEYTKTPLDLLRSDAELEREKRDQFNERISRDEKLVIISEVTLSNSEIEERIKSCKQKHEVTHVVFDSDIDADFFFRLESKFNIKVISSNMRND